MLVGEPLQALSSEQPSIPPELCRFLGKEADQPVSLASLPPEEMVRTADLLVRRAALIECSLASISDDAPGGGPALNAAVRELRDARTVTLLLLAAMAGARGLDAEVRVRLAAIAGSLPLTSRSLGSHLYDRMAIDLEFNEHLLQTAPDPARARAIREVALSLDSLRRGNVSPDLPNPTPAHASWPDVDFAVALLHFESKMLRLEQRSAILALLNACESLLPPRRGSPQRLARAAEPYLRYVHPMLEVCNVTSLRGKLEELGSRIGLAFPRSDLAPRARHMPSSGWDLEKTSRQDLRSHEAGTWLVMTEATSHRSGAVEPYGVRLSDVISRLATSGCAALEHTERIEVADADEPRRHWVLYVRPARDGTCWALSAQRLGTDATQRIAFEWMPALVVGQFADVRIEEFSRWVVVGSRMDQGSLDQALRACVSTASGSSPLGEDL